MTIPVVAHVIVLGHPAVAVSVVESAVLVGGLSRELLQPLVNVEKSRLTTRLRPQRRPSSSNH
jgi:hypothetical protein